MTFNLLRTKRFLPLLVTQFLGALNDNMFKNALLTLVTIKMTANSDILSNIIAGLFILPFFLFSALAGQIADKYPRDKIARILKIIEIILMLGVAGAYWLNSLRMLIFVLSLMGAQSAFFGPVKYALLPQQLEPNELILGNAYIESTTYGAILFGLILGTLLPTPITIVVLIALAIIGYLASTFIPAAVPARPDLKIDKNILKSTITTFAFIKKHRLIFTCIWGATWFWIIGALVVVQVYPLAGKILNVSEGVITFFLVTFSVGVAVGSFFCSKLLKGFIHATYVPLSALGMGLAMFLLYFYTNNYPTPEVTAGFLEFLQMPHAFAISFNLFMLAFWGGLYIVPLNAMMQNRAPKAYVATVIAGNNILNALGMVLVAVFAVVFISFGFSIPQLFLIMSGISLAVTGYICILLPDALTRSLVQSLLRFLFKSRVSGLGNFKRAGKRVLIVSNHVSLLDGVLLAAFMPERITFAINTEWTQKWFMPITRLLVDFYPVDPNNPLSIRALIEEIKKGRKVMIFPEGRVTTTGAMMKVYEGAGIVAARANAKILPVAIKGAQYSKFSYLKNKFKTGWFPKITLSIMEAQHFSLPSERHAVSKQLYELMAEVMYQASDFDGDILSAFISAPDNPNKKAMLKKIRAYGKVFSKRFKEQKITIMMPPGEDALIAFFALQYAGKIPLMTDAPVDNLPVITSLKEVKLPLFNLGKRKWNSIAAAFLNNGVEISLSQRNILASWQQFSEVFPLNQNDITVSSLPLSNPFGFVYGTLLPLLCGAKVFFHSNAAHYKAIPELCYEKQATYLIGNESLLNGYAASAHPYDFFTLKYVISAQESLSESTFDLWVKKFGIRILECGFIDTFATMISANTPMYNRQGTLGCRLPGIEIKTEMIKSNNIADGHWQNLEQPLVFDNDGYLTK